MLNPRQQTLLECVRKHGTISVEELAQQLNVTTQTVRRDVKAMVDACLARWGCIDILDNNVGQIDGPTDEVLSLQPIAEKWRAFNWHVIECDGNDVDAFVAAVR